MILICVGDNGDVHSFKNVLAYDAITRDDMDRVLKEMKVETTFTTEEMDIIKHRLGKFDHFPDHDDLRYVLELVIEDRAKENKE